MLVHWTPAGRGDAVPCHEVGGFTALVLPSFNRCFDRVGFALKLTVEQQHVIGGDDDFVGVLAGDRCGFCGGEAGEYARMLGVIKSRDDGLFVDVGWVDKRLHPGIAKNAEPGSGA